VLMPYASLAGLAVSSGGATFDSFAVGAISNTPQDTPPANACPSGWNCGDVSYPLVVGNQSLSGTTWTINGAGNGIGQAGTTDQFHYVWTSTTGDTTVSTHITAFDATNAGAKAGVMMRAGTSGNAPYYGAFLTPSNGVVVMERDTAGLPSQTLATISGTAPAYLRIARSGEAFTAYTSSDGATWTPIAGSTDTIPNLGGTILGGDAVTSANPSATASATADVLSVTGSAPAPPTVCPSGWTCADVGAPIPAGSNYLVNGEWSILGGGKDIWGGKDEFRYTAQTVPGDATISAEITSQQDTDSWAKSGVMLRAGIDPGAAYYAIFATPEGNGTVIQYRTASGGSTTQLSGVTSRAPIWMKVVRTGDSFTAYTSSDGTNWTAYPSSTVTIPALSGSILGGMADTSHSQFTTSTTVFDHFMYVQAGSSLPVPWSDSDIGNPTPAGSASYAGGVFTVNGGGNDIWGTLDQFNEVSQSLTGDGSVVARVTAQANTDPWAKSGIMIKQSTTAGSAYALLAVTPGNGVTFQHGYNASVSGGSYAFPNAWLKLTRAGSAITAYTSTDGTTWTQVGTTTIAMTDPVTIGLFVTSHNAGSLNTSTFDNVSITLS
jgi:regulation of enolase protein 1 (concanavalin A-like superfamily)